MKSILTIIICCITSISYSQSRIILIPEINFAKSKEKKNSSINLGNKIELNLKGGYKILPCLYAGPYLGFAIDENKYTDNSRKYIRTYFKSGFFIGYFQKDFQEMVISFNIISQFLYEKSHEKYIYPSRLSSSQYKTFRLELIPSIYIKCTSHFGINMGINMYYEKINYLTITPKYIRKKYGLHPNIGFIISLK